MKLRLWPRRPPAEATRAEPVVEAPPQPQPAPEPAPPPPPPEAEPPAKLSLTLDEAKEAIRAAKGDVIQVGFLAGDYKRHHEEDPGSRETAAARAALRAHRHAPPRPKAPGA